jgi:outer membrane protein OmpA-like peptidoglycan-associated protein
MKKKYLFFTIKFYFLIVLCFLVIPAFLSAQAQRRQSTANEIETLLNTSVVTYAQASRFVLEAANVLATGNPEEAFNYAVGQNWLPEDVASGDPARLDRISLLLVGSFKINGGIMYQITNSSHYAYRELVHMNVIQGRTTPRMSVSGERLVFYINRLLGLQDARELAENRRQARLYAREAVARRQALAAEIAIIIEEQAIADTTVQTTDEGVMITLSNIMFQADSAVLPNSERGKLQEIARILRNIPGIKIKIAGHTTRVGTDEYLLTLSTARAQSVANLLVSLGACEAGNVTIVGYGATRPLGDESTPEGMAANRRVEIIILED